jgi:NADH dehydrogenase FAD-containing subunit
MKQIYEGAQINKERKIASKGSLAKVGEFSAIGDCDKIGNVMKAIKPAYDLALKIQFGTGTKGFTWVEEFWSPEIDR